MLARWMTASVVAIGLGMAALELSACLAVEPHATTAPASESALPVGAEIEADEPSASPRLTR
jgi:hypothetical protein